MLQFWLVFCYRPGFHLLGLLERVQEGKLANYLQMRVFLRLHFGRNYFPLYFYGRLRKGQFRQKTVKFHFLLIPRIFQFLNEFEKIENDFKDPRISEIDNLDSSQEFDNFKKEIDRKFNRFRPELTGSIQFQNVWFKYPGTDQFLLRGLSLKFTANSKCAVFDVSGAGTSAIFDLLLRLYDPDIGKITIDDYDLESIDLAFLRAFFGNVRKNPGLFRGSLRDNMGYFDPKALKREINQVCEISNSIEFIESLPKGLETKIGHFDDSWSRDKKLRIALARQIQRNPSIFLIDDILSDLDSKSQEVVIQGLKNILESNHCLVCTRFQSILQNCDWIYIIQNGRLVNKGSFDELCRTSRIFKDNLSE